MITLSITTAVDESIENDWLDYMKTEHISLLMKTELFKEAWNDMKEMFAQKATAWTVENTF